MRNDEFIDEEASQLIPGDVINIEPGMTVPVRDHRWLHDATYIFLAFYHNVFLIPNLSRLCSLIRRSPCR